jgi:hypothetical protein
MIQWAPPDSLHGLGTIVLPDLPKNPLTPDQYRNLLAQRINRLVAAEEPEAALELLGQVPAKEAVTIPDDLSRVGEAMVETSNWLRNRAAFPNQPVTIRAAETVEGEPEETLEEFLSALYHDR